MFLVGEIIDDAISLRPATHEIFNVRSDTWRTVADSTLEINRDSPYPFYPSPTTRY